MAWSSLAVPSAELTALSSNVPLFVTTNRCRFNNRSARWGESLLWSDSDSGDLNNLSDTIGREFFGYDGRGGDLTYPSSPSSTTVSYFLDLDETGEIDCFALIGHNLADIPFDVTITLTIADDEGFSVRDSTISTFTLTAPHSARRLVDLTLGESITSRFSAVRYVRLTFVGASAFSTTVKPRFGELILGRRRQLYSDRLIHSDDADETSRVAFHDSDGGNATGYISHRRRRDITPQWTLYRTGTNDEVQLFDDIWADTDGGVRPMLYLRQPNVDAQDAPLVYMPAPSKRRRYLGPNHASQSMALLERKPFVGNEV